jgi:ferredoxin-NADP reductase
VAFIGAGVGIAPLRALAAALPYELDDTILLHRYSYRPLFLRELKTLADLRGLRIIRLRGHRRAPDSWLGSGIGNASDVEALLHWIPDIAERDVYVCGPPQWVGHVRRTARAAGLPADQFHNENFGW